MVDESPFFPSDLLAFLRRRPFSIVNNLSTRTPDFLLTAEYLLRVGCPPRTLFTPEHGWDLGYQEFEKTPEAEFRGIPVRPLYRQGGGIEGWIPEDSGLLLFDLDSPGLRCFTYASLLYQVMRECETRRFELALYERPCLIDAPPAGPLLEPGFESYVGLVPTPFLYGQDHAWLAAYLYRKSKMNFPIHFFYGDQKYRESIFSRRGFFRPSPNLDSTASLALYPATVLFEGTDFSEGRGTEYPFQIFGTPGFPTGEFLDHLPPSLEIFATFQEITFIPSRSKWRGMSCRGLRIFPTDAGRKGPFQLALELFCFLTTRFMKYFSFPESNRGRCFFDRLVGTDRLRTMMLESRPPAEIMAAFEPGVTRFRDEAGEYVAEIHARRSNRP